MTYLSFSRKEGERYYLLVTQPLDPGVIIKITQGNFNYGKSHHHVSAPSSVVIMREELVEEKGGLAGIVRQIREGIFKFRANGSK